MPTINDTAYPRLKSSISEKELKEIYTPTSEEFNLAHTITNRTAMRIAFLVLLKTYQRIGYFLPLHKVPRQIAEHISLIYGVHYEAMEWEAYDVSGSRHRHTARIREYLGIRKFDEKAQKTLLSTAQKAAQLRDDVVDIINIIIEEFARLKYELPPFSILCEEAKRAKTNANREYFDNVTKALGTKRCKLIDHLLVTDGIDRKSLWNSIKRDPGAPTLKQIRLWVERLRWLKSLNLHSDDIFTSVPTIRLQSFASEAHSLNASRMLEMKSHKRFTLAAALIRRQVEQCFDDLGEMLIRKLRKIHYRAREEFKQALLERQLQTDRLIAAFFQLLTIWIDNETLLEQKQAAIASMLDQQAESLFELCKTHEALTKHN